MKISVKKLDALRCEMSVEVPQQHVALKSEEVMRDIVRHASIKGFRPGKAPRKMVESTHGKLAREEMMKKLIPEAYQQGIAQEKLDPIDFPAIDQVEMKDGALTFRATFDLRPKVEVKDYKGITLTRKKVDVSDEDVNKSLEFFKKSRGVEENAPVDDAFAKNVGFPSLEDLKKAVRQNLEMEKDRQNNYEVETQLVDALIARSKFDVPQSLVDRQLEGRMEEFFRRLKTYGMKDEDIAKKAEAASKDLRGAAEKDVRTFLILREIAGLEKIDAAASDNLSAKVMEFLFKEAKWEDVK
ncbi:MAG: trigger factor [Candidatus Omnitrophota bacterium]